MNKAIKQILFCVAVLTVVCVSCRVLFFDSYTIYTQGPVDQMKVTGENLDRFQVERTEIREDYAIAEIRPEEPGRASVDLQDEHGETIGMHPIWIGKFHTVYDYATGGFTGDSILLVAVTVFSFAISIITLNAHMEARGAAQYSYYNIFYTGMFFFAQSTGIVMLIETVRHISNPAVYVMLNAYSSISGAPMRFMQFTMPAVLVFAISLAVSNIELLRHERPRVQNLLGIMISIMMIGGGLLGQYLASRDFMGSETEFHIRQAVDNTYAAFYSYCECMLAGAVICGIKAAKYIPAHDKDYIIILGCYFRKDGTLPPLLKGRVDRAISFWTEQKQKTGKEAVFIPSGGQGANESMAEAEAMARYLKTQGVPERLICKEDQSKNTYQNMAFSKEMIHSVEQERSAEQEGSAEKVRGMEEARGMENRVVFSTTNYHVFRSGVWASLAGLPAEGIGSRTKWWYWPNAFIRECAGLMRNRLKQEILLLIFFMVFFGALSMAL